MPDYVTVLQKLDAAVHRLAELEGDDIHDGWLGYPGCQESQLAATEARLGVSLPETFRQFLRASNGWQRLSLNFGRLYAAEELRWFREENADWIEAYWLPPDEESSEEEHLSNPDEVAFRRAYMHDCLQISEPYDGGVYLLNPSVRTQDGEWEAWAFANWFPGAYRFTSFADLLETELQTLQSDVRDWTLPIDEAELIDRALPRIRGIMHAGGFDASTAVSRYMVEMAGNEQFEAWTTQSGGTGPVILALEKAVKRA